MNPEIAELFIERFPRYALALYEWIPSQRHEEPAPLSEMPLEEAEILYLFGFNAETALQLRPWLSSDLKRRLIFLEPEPGIIATLLYHPSAKEILSQTQIEIYLLPQKKEKNALIEELARRYPLRGAFVCFCGGNRRDFTRLKLQLLRKTALTHANYADRFCNHILLSHLNQKLKHLPSAFYANGLKNAFPAIPAIICGAGPSLEQAIETLRSLENRAILFAGGSAIAALSAYGIEPHFAVAIDPNPEEFERLKNSFAFQTPLLFSSRLHPNCLAACNGPLGYLRSGMSGIAELWFEEQIGLIDALLGENLPSESLSVTTLSASIAYHFGCDPILFEGIDLAYTNNRRYADGIEADETKSPLLPPVDRRLHRLNRHGKKVATAVRWVMEAHALSQFARRSKKCRWVQCTADGLKLKGIESMPLAEAAKLFPPERDLRGLIHQAIACSPMPQATASILEEKTKELATSLDRVLSHLDILVENKPGLSALAEIELKEELACSILFYDIENTLRITLLGSDDKIAYWKAFRELARNCQKSLNEF